MAKLLSCAEHIGEPEADEADPSLLDRPQDVVELLLHPDSVRTVFRAHQRPGRGQ